MFAFQRVEDPRCPLRIGTVVECNCDLVRACPVTADAVRLGQRIHDLVADQASRIVHGDLALTVPGSRLDIQNLPAALHVYVLTGRNIRQFRRRSHIKREIPDLPKRPVFRT